jgi:methyl-accepting chemotaxis protein
MHKSILFGFAAVTVILVLSALAANRSIRTLTQSTEAVAQTHQVKHELVGLLSSLTDMETGQRGYILTGDQVHLAPYHSGEKQLAAHLQQAAALLNDNASQQRRLAELKPLIDTRLATLARAIEIWGEQGPEG